MAFLQLVHFGQQLAKGSMAVCSYRYVPPTDAYLATKPVSHDVGQSVRDDPFSLEVGEQGSRVAHLLSADSREYVRSIYERSLPLNQICVMFPLIF